MNSHDHKYHLLALHHQATTLSDIFKVNPTLRNTVSRQSLSTYWNHVTSCEHNVINNRRLNLCYCWWLDDFLLRAPIDEGSKKVVVISNDVTTVDGLAVDWLYNHIYWTNTDTDTIEVSIGLDGNTAEVLELKAAWYRDFCIAFYDCWIYERATILKKPALGIQSPFVVHSHFCTLIRLLLARPQMIILIMYEKTYTPKLIQKFIELCYYS